MFQGRNRMTPANQPRRTPAGSSRFTSHRRHGDGPVRESVLTALLIFELLVLFLAVPIAATLDLQGPLIGGFAILLTLILAVTVLSHSMAARVLAVVAATVALAGASLRVASPSLLTIWFGHVAVILAIAAVSIVIARVVFGRGEVTPHRIRGAVVLYLNIAVAFTSAYRLVLELNPAAFTGASSGRPETAAFDEMLYFSFTTLTSTGYGEIVPLSPAARSLTNLEAITGQLYLAILLARLVSLYAAGRHTSPPDHET